MKYKYFKNKAAYYGYCFGTVCKVLGNVCTIIFAILLPNEKIIINRHMIIPFILSLTCFLYGFWRTGGYNER